VFVRLPREARLKTRKSSSDSRKKCTRMHKNDTEKMFFGFSHNVVDN
jgi:hypothetical protein